MTKKPYPKPYRVSPSPRPGATRRRRAALSPDAPVANVPQTDHFVLLHPTHDDDHPVDAMVDRIPAIAARARHLRQLARMVQARCQDDDLFLRYEDLRLHQQTDREETYFNAGWDHGALASRAEEQVARISPAARVFRDKLQVLLTTSRLDHGMAAATMLTYVRALVVGLRPSLSRSGQRARKLQKAPRGR
jgi:hypothetical protein